MAQPEPESRHQLESSESSFQVLAECKEDLINNLNLLQFPELTTNESTETSVVPPADVMQKSEAAPITQSIPQNDLGRLLSQRPALSTSSTSARVPNEAAISDVFSLRKIGAGSCGAIFAPDGTVSVFKLQKNLSGGSKVADLWNDFQMHHRIRKGITSVTEVSANIKIPRLYAWITRTSTEFWEEHEHLFKDAAAQAHVQLPTNLIKAERILPLSRPIRARLIDTFCPAELKESAHRDQSNRDCLIRVYLGRSVTRSSAASRFFSLRNFPMSVDQMLKIGINMQKIASSMAGTLATLHWRAYVDARDVEFVLGSSPTTKTANIDISETSLDGATMDKDVKPGPISIYDWDRREINLWLLDFNLCTSLSLDESGVEMAATAWRDNDPYFPKPLQESSTCKELWSVFVQRYVEIADRILQKDKHHLPRMFIRRIIEIEKERAERHAASQSRDV